MTQEAIEENENKPKHNERTYRTKEQSLQTKKAIFEKIIFKILEAKITWITTKVTTANTLKNTENEGIITMEEILTIIKQLSNSRGRYSRNYHNKNNINYHHYQINPIK